jgi:cytoskeletal protein CcmA (bactofilin family)
MVSFEQENGMVLVRKIGKAGFKELKVRTVKATRPPAFERDRLTRKSFTCRADVVIHGDLKIDGRLIVGGNLIVDGNLEVGELFCAGRVVVLGRIVGGDAQVGMSISSGADMDFASLITGTAPEDMAAMLDLSVDKLVDPLIAAEFDDMFGDTAVDVGGVLDCYYLETHGGVIVKGSIDLDIGEIGGDVEASDVYVEEYLLVCGVLTCAHDISCGKLDADDIYCDGNLRGGPVKAIGETVSVRGHIEVDDLLVDAGKIQAGV